MSMIMFLFFFLKKRIHLLMQGVRVQSLARELTFYKSISIIKENKNRKRALWTLPGVNISQTTDANQHEPNEQRTTA